MVSDNSFEETNDTKENETNMDDFLDTITSVFSQLSNGMSKASNQGSNLSKDFDFSNMRELIQLLGAFKNNNNNNKLVDIYEEVKTRIPEKSNNSTNAELQEEIENIKLQIKEIKSRLY